eukprot:NODE_311_length_11244_cov_0.423419.p7 type:complete len:145 gc:universal NODE_311_length_11244_cov_0.423419:4044-4478(+)
MPITSSWCCFYSVQHNYLQTKLDGVFDQMVIGKYNQLRDLQHYHHLSYHDLLCKYNSTVSSLFHCKYQKGKYSKETRNTVLMVGLGTVVIPSFDYNQTKHKLRLPSVYSDCSQVLLLWLDLDVLESPLSKQSKLFQTPYTSCRS